MSDSRCDSNDNKPVSSDKDKVESGDNNVLPADSKADSKEALYSAKTIDGYNILIDVLLRVNLNNHALALISDILECSSSDVLNIELVNIKSGSAVSEKTYLAHCIKQCMFTETEKIKVGFYSALNAIYRLLKVGTSIEFQDRRWASLGLKHPIMELMGELELQINECNADMVHVGLEKIPAIVEASIFSHELEMVAEMNTLIQGCIMPSLRFRLLEIQV